MISPAHSAFLTLCMTTRNKPTTAQTIPNGSFLYDPALNLAGLDHVGHRRGGTIRPEGLIPPANRRSLTVHRPCWLPGSAARSAEPSRPQSTRESTPADGGFRAQDKDLELLRAIATSKVFTEFEGAFTEATGLPVALEPVQSLQFSFSDRKIEGPFCAWMATENRTCGPCLQSQSQVAHTAKENSHTTVYNAASCETVVPLRLGNRLIGFLRAGQVFRGKTSDVLQGPYFEMRVLSREQHTAAIKLLAIFAEHLAVLSNRILIQRNNLEPPMITKAKEFIHKHHGEDLSLPQVAQFANVNPFHFCKLFKRATGLTFTKFLSRVRVESARNLLVNPQLRVSEVAYEVGFQSLTHFNRVFQKLLGQSPTEYRLKVQNGDKAGLS